MKKVRDGRVPCREGLCRCLPKGAGASGCAVVGSVAACLARPVERAIAHRGALLDRRALLGRESVRCRGSGVGWARVRRPILGPFWPPLDPASFAMFPAMTVWASSVALRGPVHKDPQAYFLASLALFLVFTEALNAWTHVSTPTQQHPRSGLSHGLRRRRRRRRRRRKGSRGRKERSGALSRLGICRGAQMPAPIMPIMSTDTAWQFTAMHAPRAPRPRPAGACRPCLASRSTCSWRTTAS